MDATFQNLGFEIAGSASGLAATWDYVERATAEEIAGFGSSPEEPTEGFERGWADNDHYLFAFAPASVEPTLYDSASGVPKSIEGFEEGWSQDEAFLFELASVAPADFGGGGAPKLVDDFDGLWAGNSTFQFSLGEADVALGPLDDFELGWRQNQSFLVAFGSLDIALGPLEGFESGFTAMRTV